MEAGPVAAARAYQSQRQDTHRIFEELGIHLGRLAEGSSSPRASTDVRLSSFFGNWKGLKARFTDEKICVAVLALTKAGETLVRRPLQTS